MKRFCVTRTAETSAVAGDADTACAASIPQCPAGYRGCGRKPSPQCPDGAGGVAGSHKLN